MGCALCRPVFLFSQNGIYSVDLTRSEIAFKVSHLGPFKVKGSFSEYSGNLQFKGNEFVSLEAEVQFKSIDTGNEERDEILQTEPYFDTDQYPVITYWADRLSVVGDETSIHGRLTIKAEENYLSFPVIVNYDDEKDEISLSGETEIRRKNYKLKFGSMNGLIGDKVSIEINIIATKE